MQLKGEKEASEFFQLRSKSCGKALFQRGQTDIFMVTVPGKVLSIIYLINLNYFILLLMELICVGESWKKQENLR